MNDDRIIKLLEEIRDLQRQHVENYRNALANQQESIRLQSKYARRTLPLIILVILFMIWTLFGSTILRWFVK